MHEDAELLADLGKILDERPRGLKGTSLRDFLISALLMIRDKHGRLVRLRANRAQREFSKRCGLRNIVLKARQMGITTWVAARFFLATITRRGSMTVLVAHDQAAAEEIFRIVHRFWENLPERLREGALRTSRANVRQLVFPELDSEYRVETAADPDAGRGLTIQYLHASEVARWPRDSSATLASLRAAVAPQGEMVMESTPRGTSGCFYQEWQQAAEAGTVRHFFPWWWEEGYTRNELSVVRLTEEEQKLMEEEGLSRGQIAYRREIKANFRGLAKQEFAEDAHSCFLASDECYFDLESIEARLKECSVLSEAQAEQKLWVFAPVIPERQYIVGVDPAGGGTEGDYACVQVIDHASGMQCAELHGHLDPAETARRATALARQYNQALLVVENNGVGAAVLAHLTQGEKYERIFSRKGSAGYSTNTATRPAIVGNFAAVFSVEPGIVCSPRLLKEMKSFVRQSSGRPEAAAGAHDDCVMAMALALKVREETVPTRTLPVMATSLSSEFRLS